MSEIILKGNASGTGKYTLSAPNVSSDVGLTLPVDDGASGQLLKSDGSGNMSWITKADAPLASPTLTGTPAAPTAAVDTNTTQIATTAFVKAQIADTFSYSGGVLTITTT